MPSARQITLVRNNFRALSSQRPDLFISVYNRQLGEDPEAAAQYDGSLRQRARVLDGLIELALLSADHPTALFATLHKMGQDYAHYGSWREKHPFLIQQIIETFAEATGTPWTEELAEAWDEFLYFMADGMLEGVKSSHVA
ncbi:hypothetical protein [Celeribacter sp. SCSIO 80788]|jgi:hemoglobin-like flavoprotein|uniref:hypothetical protein n=1 Tax=Celeribacter sp. SCSIO 80788 TaxID=3117013 RepID=UPI003DA27DA6